MKVIEEFKKFILRGNVIDLGVAIVIGAAFTGIINALVKDLITPLIAAIGGKQDFSNLSFTINNSNFYYGDFINAIISFLLISLVIFFLVVTPINAFLSATKKQVNTPDPSTKKCSECLSEIPINAKKCAFCTSVLIQNK